MWSRSLKLVFFSAVGLLAFLCAGSARSLLASSPPAPVPPTPVHVGSVARFRSRIIIAAPIRAMIGKQSSLRLASDHEDTWHERTMPSSLTQVVTIFQGGNPATLIVVVIAVFMFMQQKATIARLAQRVTENDEKNEAKHALHERRITELTAENTHLHQEVAKCRDAATETPALSHEYISLLLEVQTLLSSWMTPGTMPWEGEEISGCDALADLRSSGTNSGRSRSTASDVVVINPEQQNKLSPKQLLVGTFDAVVKHGVGQLQLLAKHVDVEASKRIAETTAAFKGFTKHGCERVRVLAVDGLGVEAVAVNTLVSGFTDGVNNMADEWGRAGEEIVRSRTQSVVEHANAFIGLSKQEEEL